jgi:hypothetical protein
MTHLFVNLCEQTAVVAAPTSTSAAQSLGKVKKARSTSETLPPKDIEVKESKDVVSTPTTVTTHKDENDTKEESARPTPDKYAWLKNGKVISSESSCMLAVTYDCDG